MKIRLLILTICCCWAGLCLAQQRFFVNQAATGQNTGQSWANAFTNLHLALNQTQKGDEVWVAQGTYKPHPTDRSIWFEQRCGVGLYGGFKGTEAMLSERDIELYPTILDGDIGTPGDSTDNSYTIVYMAYPDTSTIIDGFTIRNGTANRNNASDISPEKCGAGMYIMGYDSIAYGKIRNCRFKHNSTSYIGGAVYVSGLGMGSVSPQFIDCVFEDNSSQIRGGAVFWSGSSIYDPGADFIGCNFYRNYAQGLGKSIFINFEFGSDSVEISNCTFLTEDRGAGEFSFNDPVDTLKKMIFTGTTFHLSKGDYIPYLSYIVGNLSEYSTSLSELRLKNCKILSDSASFYFSYSSPALINSSDVLITLSNTEMTNATILFESEDSNGNDHIVLKVDNCNSTNTGLGANNNKQTIVDNSKLSYGIGTSGRQNNIRINNSLLGIGKLGKSTAGTSVVEINNSLIYNSYAVLNFPGEGGTAKISNTIFENNKVFSGNETYNSDLYFFYADSVLYENCYFSDTTTRDPVSFRFGAGNIFQTDPMFLDTANQDYHLHPCSPLINAGTNTPIIDLAIDSDLDGNPRILDGTVDIGPYESNHVLGQMSPPNITAACYGLAEGKVMLAAEGGCPPYALAWTRSDDGSMGSDTTGLLAGNYLFTLTDARGRQLEVPLQIGGSTPQVTIVGDSLACAFTPNAFLQANATNATQPIDFQWNTGQNTGSINNLGAGLYSVEITDGFGCKDSASVEVTATPPVNASIQVINATGANKSDGALNFAVSSGYPPYSFEWSNGATTDSISNLLPGDYTVTVIDGNNCGYVFTYTVSFMVDTEVPTLPDATNTVWPNPLPTGAPLNVRFSTADLWHLMDAQGRVVCSVERTFSPFSSRTDAEAIGTGYMQTMQIELPCLASGTYFWSFSRAGRSVSAGKLVL